MARTQRKVIPNKEAITPPEITKANVNKEELEYTDQWELKLQEFFSAAYEHNDGTERSSLFNNIIFTYTNTPTTDEEIADRLMRTINKETTNIQVLKNPAAKIAVISPLIHRIEISNEPKHRTYDTSAIVKSKINTIANDVLRVWKSDEKYKNAFASEEEVTSYISDIMTPVFNMVYDRVDDVVYRTINGEEREPSAVLLTHILHIPLTEEDNMYFMNEENGPWLRARMLSWTFARYIEYFTAVYILKFKQMAEMNIHRKRTIDIKDLSIRFDDFTVKPGFSGN